MLIQPIYYIVFYDLSKPKTAYYAITKRVDKKQFHNILDDMGVKQMDLKNRNGEVGRFTLKSVSTFQIVNTVDNTLIAVCECQKINSI